MTGEASFVHGKKYRCRVITGSGWDRSNQKRTPFFRLHLEVVGGEMEGAKLLREMYFTKKTEDGVVSEFQLAFGLDLRATNLHELADILLSKECAAQCEISKSQDGKRELVRANRIMSVAEMASGSVESEVASLLNNKATPEASSDGYSDQF